MTTYVYIDGFNLYYGAVRRTPYKWLNLEALCRNLLPREDVTQIRYFTARVTQRPDNLTAPRHQETYLRALRTLPLVSTHFGHFLTHRVWAALADPPPAGTGKVQVMKSEEKGSDVNLATYLLVDGFRSAYDTAVVITNDSDLYEPIRVVQHEFGLKVGVVNPHRTSKRSRKFDTLGVTFFKQLREPVLAKSQFPKLIRDARGRQIHKPADW